VSLKRNVVANFLGQGWSALMSLAFVPVYIRYLGIEAYGLIGLVAVIQAWLVLLDMGMTPTLTREMARFEAGQHTVQSIADMLRSLEIVGFAVTGLIFGGMVLAAGLLTHSWLRAGGLPPHEVEQAIHIAGILVALRFIEAIYRGAIYGLQRQVWFNAVNAVLATVRATGVIAVLAWVAPTVEAYLMWQAALAVVPVVLYAWKAHAVLPSPPLPPRFSMRALKQVRQFAGGMVATTVTVLLLTQVDKALLTRLLTLESFGYYMLASAVSSALFMLIGPITAASYPRMVSLADDGDARAEASLYHFVAQLVTVALAPAALLLAFYAEGVLFVWSGDPVLAGRVAPILSILSVGTLLNALMQVPHNLQLAHGWTSLATYANLVAIAVLVPALWWLVPVYGGIAAAWIWVALNVGYLIATAPLMFRRLMPTEMKAWYLEDLALPVGGLLAALLITLLLRPAGFTDRWHWLSFLALAAMLSWSTAAWLAPRVRTQMLSWRGRGMPR
jgi:O-antigen/teichoic acid export membrane protein